MKLQTRLVGAHPTPPTVTVHNDINALFRYYLKDANYMQSIRTAMNHPVLLDPTLPMLNADLWRRLVIPGIVFKMQADGHRPCQLVGMEDSLTDGWLQFTAQLYDALRTPPQAKQPLTRKIYDNIKSGGN